MIAAFIVAAAAAEEGGSGWLETVLTFLAGSGLLAVVTAALRKWLKIEEPTPAPPNPTLAGGEPMPRTAAGQLALADKYVAKLEEDAEESDRRTGELETKVARLTGELGEARKELEWLRARDQEQRQTIGLLRNLLEQRPPT